MKMHRINPIIAMVLTFMLVLAASHSFAADREARKQRYGGEPLSSQAIADQQAVADIFFKLGLIPKAIRVETLVYHPAR